MKIKFTIKSVCLLLILLVVSGQAMALPCYITSTSDSGSGSQATLRKVLETNLAENATEICDSEYTPDGDNDNFVGDFYFEQAVLIDPSVSFTSGSSLKSITLGSQLDVDLPWTAVIGNPGDGVFSDTASDVDYTGSADNSFSSDAPQDSFYNVQYLVIDARNLADGTSPFNCKSGTNDLYLRNTIVLTNNVTSNDVFSGCVKDAGNTFVCKNDYDSTVTPGDSGWCSSSFDFEHFPFDPDWDWSDLFIFKRWYRDADGDGFGDPNDSVTTMRGDADHADGPAGYVSNNDDCDDTNSDINPDGTETCNGLDDDCNGLVDDNPTDAVERFPDTDGDNFGDPSNPTDVCRGEDGYVRNDDDCDDSNENINPDATEICDGLDNNCDGAIDENATDEICDTFDNDCDGSIDEDDACGTSGDTDDDGDGFCENATCSDGSTPGDCDDTNENINPDATEICDSVDNDCDSSIDEDDVCLSDGETDDDSDGFCESATCSDGSTPGDCDDSNINTNPNAAEVCDTVDNNCDGSTDENNVCDSGDDDIDNDGDGFCESVDGCSDGSNPGDCNDANTDINPNEMEICDFLDNNCDSSIDESNVCGGEGKQPNAEEECSDTIDNDSDGSIDCADISCTGTLVCNINGEGLGSDNPEVECSDKSDNDEDGLKDCFDPGCLGTIVCNNLGEGLGNTADAESECSDSIDSDFDGLTDCNDPNCAGTATCDENGEGIGSDREQTCSDDVDNDNDKMTDCLDPGCFGTIACNVSGEGLGTDDTREEACADNLDNDIDGLTDCEEPSCATTTVCEIEVTPSVDVDPDTSGDISSAFGQIQGGSSCSLNPTATHGSNVTTFLLIALGLFGILNASRREES